MKTINDFSARSAWGLGGAATPTLSSRRSVRPADSNRTEESTLKACPTAGFTAIRRAAMMLLAVMLTTTTAWAQSAIGSIQYNADGGYYEIGSTDNLNDLAVYVNGTGTYSTGDTETSYHECRDIKFKMTADITYTHPANEGDEYAENFTAIAGYHNNGYRFFRGEFDGNGHTISGIRIRKTGGDYDDAAKCQAIFGRINTGANIHDVHLTDARIKGNSRVGGIVGHNGQNTKLSGCLVTESEITITNTSSNDYGAICGYNEGNNTIRNNYYHGCIVNGTAVTSGWGCYGADLGANNGAVPARTVALTVSGHGSVAIGDASSWLVGGHIYAPAGATVTLSAPLDAGYLLDLAATGLTLTTGQFTMPDNDDGTITATFTPNPAHFSQSGNEYTIHTAAGWGVFCDALQDNTTYNRFSGKTVKLGNSITVTRMAGSSNHDFCGTFDGQGNTITLAIGSAESPFTEEYAALFRNVTTTKANPGDAADSPASIHSLVVDGHIYTSEKFAAGIVGNQYGTASIENCHVSTIIHSSKNDDGTHGGIVANQHGGTLTIEGCIYDGRLLTTNGTIKCGGLVGYRSGTCTISNSLYAPNADYTPAEGESDITDGATICRNYSGTPANCIYTRALGSAQGKQRHTVTAGANVTIEPIALTGSTMTYDVSGITAYSGGGLALDNGATLYYGKDDQVRLTLANSATDVPAGYLNSYGFSPSAGTLSGSTLTMPDNDVVVSVKWVPDPTHFSVNADGTEYTIHTATGWNVFCDALDDNVTYNRFSGKTVKMDGDIPTDEEIANGTTAVTRMAGKSQHDFCGTFDGGGHTLRVSLSSTYGQDYTAPFSYVANTKANPGDTSDSPAAIRNLKVTGTVNASKNYASGIVGAFWGTLNIEDCTSSVTINTGNKHAAGFIGHARGDVTIRNCLSDVTINSSVSGDGTHGGLIGVSVSGKTFTIEGCAFTGSLLTTNATTHCAGFVGYNSGTLNITNSLFAPDEVSVGASNSATFARNGDGCVTNISNSYYTQTLGEVQGKQRRSIAAGEGVTLSHAGVATEYSVSGITAYKASAESSTFMAGILYDDVLYAGADDAVSLTLANSAGDAPLGYTNGDYCASAGSLSGSTLTMPDCDVTVSLHLSSDGQSHSVTYMKADGTTDTHEAIALDGSETSLAAGWYYVGTNINYSQAITLKGDVTIILKDGAVMNIGTAQSPVSGNGISGNNYSFSIYAQSTGDDKGKLYVNATVDAIYTKNVTISGGQVTASGGSFGILTENNVTISGGQVTANGGIYGIYASGNITLGWTSLTDFIQAKSFYSENSSVSIAEGKAFAVYNDEDLTSYLPSGTLNDEQVEAIGGKTLQAVASIPVVQNLTITDVTTTGATLTWEPGNVETQWQVAYSTDGGNTWSEAETVTETTYTLTGFTAGTSVTVRVRAYYNDNLCSDFATSTFSTLLPVSYIDAEGNPQQRADYTILTGSETSLNAGWYVADKELNYSETIWLSGEVHLILQDNAVMNVGTEGSPISGDGISGFGYSFSIYAQSTGGSKGKLHVNATGGAIYTKNITISGGQVTAYGGSFGIYTSAGNVTISGGQVEANGSTLGIYASSDLTLGWTSLTDFIQASSYYSNNGTVSIAEGKAFAVYNDEVLTSYLPSCTLNDEQVEAIGGKTLRPVTSIPVVQNLTITDVTTTGATLTWEPGNVETQWQVAYSTDGGNNWSDAETVTHTYYNITGLTAGTSVTVRVRAYYNDNLYSNFATSTFTTLLSVSYLDAEGTTQQRADYTILTGSETELDAGWYVAEGNLSYSQAIELNGDVTIILKDNAVVNVGMEQTPVSGNGINAGSHSVSIYAQSTGDDKGQLKVYATNNGIYVNGGNVTITGGEMTATSNNGYDGIYATKNGSTGGCITLTNATVTASGAIGIEAHGGLTINSGTVTANGNYGIMASGCDLFIKGGKVTATGTAGYAIYANGGNVEISGGEVEATGGEGYDGISANNITLGWTNADDRIYANSYRGTVNIAPDKIFIDEDGTLHTSDNVGTLGGKMLRPYNGPRNLTVSDITTTSATLTWEAGHGETQWTVSHSIDNGASWTEPATVTTTPTYSLTGLTADATVVVKVQPIKANGEADGEPATVSFTTLMCEPENQCAISYDLVDSYGDGWNGASIAVVRATNGKEVASLTMPEETSSLSGELLLCPGEYNFIWKSSNYDSECSFTLTGPDGYVIANYSEAPSAGQFAQYTLDCNAPMVPQDLAVSDITTTSATVTWQPGDEETQWAVSYSSDNGTTWSDPVTVSGQPSYTITGLEPGAAMQVRVQAVCGEDNMSRPVTISFYTLFCEPENQCAISYTLGVSDPQYPSWYGSYIKVVHHETGAVLATLTYTDGTANTGELFLCDGETYDFVFDTSGYPYATFTLTGPDGYVIANYSSSPSAGQFAQYTLDCDAPKIPQNLTVSNLNETGATLTWEPGDLETQWQVAYSTDGGTTWSEAETVTEPTYTLTGLTTGTSVTVRVWAYYDDSLYSKYVTCTFTPNSPVSYLDAEGNTQQRADYTILTGSETSLNAGWYVADGTLSYSQQITLNGDVHLILKDGAVMNVGTAQSPISGDGIYGYGHSLSIYAQSAGGDKGQLNVDATNYAIYVSNGDINICGGKVTVKGRNYYGINKGTGTLNIVAGEVTATGGSTGIYAGGGSVNISGGKVTANGSSNGIFSSIDITISGGEVTATGNNGIYGSGSTLNISGGKVTAIGNANGIYISGDDITISGGQVEARGSNYGIYDSGDDITISGGQVTANGNDYGIYSSGGYTYLGWTNPTDFIHANSYWVNYSSTDIILNNTFFDEDGNSYSGTIAKENGAYAIDGKTLSPYKVPRSLTVSNITTTSATLTWAAGGEETQWLVSWSTDNGSTWSTPVVVDNCQYGLTGISAGTIVRVKVQAVLGVGVYSAPATCIFGTLLNYLDISGTTQTRTDYTILTGSETKLAAGWYVADGTLSFSQQITLNGDVHLILKDGAVMNVGTAQSPISGDGIYGYGHSLSIYAQSTGGDKGQLNVDATNYAIYVSPGDINICGGKVTVKGNNNGIAKGTGTLNIVAGEVTATGGSTGIHAGGGSVNISGGKVTANGNANGIYSSIDITISGGEVTATGNNGIEGGGSTLNISGGKVTAIGNANGIYISGDDITISGGQVEARGSNYGIYDSGDDITISGGQVTANGNDYGIYSSGGYTYLGWTNPTDFIHANSYCVVYSSTDIILNNTFFDEDGNSYSGTIAKVNDAYAIDGKTLMGVDVLEDAAANDIAAIGGKHTNIMLNGRTLWKDGAWNTLCLPFSMTAEQVTAQLAPAGLMTLSTSSFADGTLSLTFEDATTIEAGRPYIIRWSKPDGYTADGGFDITNPVFQGVTVPSSYSSAEDITEALATASRQTDYVDFIGTFSPTIIYESDAEKHNLYLGSDNKLYYPTVTDYQVKACRGYFQLKGLTAGEHANNGVRSFVLNFGDEATGVTTPLSPARGAGGEAWYSIDGVRLDGKPTRKGVYILNGRKVVVK